MVPHHLLGIGSRACDGALLLTLGWGVKSAVGRNVCGVVVQAFWVLAQTQRVGLLRGLVRCLG